MFLKATTSTVNVNLSPCLGLNSGYKHRRHGVSVGCIGTKADSVTVNGVPSNKRVGSVNGSHVVADDKSIWKEEKLEPLWDDGYGNQSVKDYLDLAKDVIKPDGGPPRWFCPVVSNGNDGPIQDSPVLLFLPGMDGLGLGLILHHKSLGKVFEVRCLHIPVHDRTPFEDLVTFVEETLRFEHASFPRRPIYLVGDSLGGCLALAVAARNPAIDLVVILANPATSFDRSQLQPLLPILDVMPDTLHVTIPYLLSFVMGDPIKMALVNVQSSPFPNLEKLSANLTALLPRLSGLSDIIPKSTLLWKLKLLKSASAYANSRLHAVKAEVLVLASTISIPILLHVCFLSCLSPTLRRKKRQKAVLPGAVHVGCLLQTIASPSLRELLQALAVWSPSHCEPSQSLSGKDNMLPSRDEAQRLSRTLQKCKICYYKDNGHTILLEDGVNLLTIIKGTLKYRRTWKHDFVKDYLPPSMSEYRSSLEGNGWFQFATSPVMLSTLADGRIVRGLAGVPDDGPVLLVGYHMLMGLELAPLILEFLREKSVIVRGVAHPELFMAKSRSELLEFSYFDLMTVFGALPVTPSNLFKLLSTKSFALLYPGGAREALHRKGEEYKLFWPDQPEFVRMAARFGATIVPFGVVGEDDIAQLILDYDDLMRIPVVNNYLDKLNQGSVRLRREEDGEVANQAMYIPGLVPKVPGRFYYLFGKPIQTKGMEKTLKEDREKASELYRQVKSQVEESIAYLIKKRDKDPYRGIVDRILTHPISTPVQQLPTFEP